MEDRLEGSERNIIYSHGTSLTTLVRGTNGKCSEQKALNPYDSI